MQGSSPHHTLKVGLSGSATSHACSHCYTSCHGQDSWYLLPRQQLPICLSGEVSFSALLTLCFGDRKVVIRAELDTCSGSSMVSEWIASMLHVKRHSTHLDMSGLVSDTTVKQYCTLNISTALPSDFDLEFSMAIGFKDSRLNTTTKHSICAQQQHNQRRTPRRWTPGRQDQCADFHGRLELLPIT